MNTQTTQNTISATGGSTLGASPDIITPAPTSTFVDNAGSQVESPPVVDNNTLFSLVDIDGSRDLVSFLERPVMFQAGNLTTLDSGKLFILDPFLRLMQAWSNKLVGVYLVKADVEIVVKVNAVRFQAGRYIGAFVPSLGRSTADQAWTSWLNMHTANLMQITQLPHVEIDVATQTAATLEIPFQYVRAAWTNQSNLATSESFGSFFLYPYVPMVSAGTASTASYTVWGRFKNISLSAPTITQAGSPGEAEQRAAGIGPVSRTLQSVAKASDIMGSLPVIGAGFNNLAWVSNVLSRAANVFGWSKPINLSANHYFVQRPVFSIQNVDQLSTANPISLVSTNRVKPYPIGHSVYDEMSLDYVKTKYAFSSKFLWKMTDTPTTILKTIQCSPDHQEVFALGYSQTPVAFPLNFFQQWRGGLKFRFKFVKNEFYSGRIGFVFIPFGTGGNTPIAANIDYGRYTNRVIVDVRDGNEFEISVPYTHGAAYLGNAEKFGSLVAFVVDALVAPDTVANQINVIVEVAGMDDMEYADPWLKPINLYAPAVTQSGTTEVPTFSLGKPQAYTLTPSSLAIGEKIESLRQLVKHLNMLPSTGAIPFDITKAQFLTAFGIPFKAQLVTNADPLLTANFQADNYSLISACYAGQTGGVRVQLLPIGNTTVTTAAVVHGHFTGAMYQKVTALSSRYFRYIVDFSKEFLVDINLPAYNPTAGRATAALMACEGAGINPSGVGVATEAVGVQAISYGSWLGDHIWGRQASDDWNAYVFLATPLLTDG